MMRLVLLSLILSATAFQVPLPSRVQVRSGALAPASPLGVSQLSSTESTVDGLGMEDTPLAAAAPEMESDEGAASGGPKKVERERHTLFIGNLDFDLTEGDIMDLVSQHAEVKLVSLPRNSGNGMSRGFCFVDVATEEQLDQAIAALDGSMVGTRPVRVNKSEPTTERKKSSASMAPPVPQVPEGYSRLYCANLPFETTEEEVAEFFRQYGEVMDVYIPMNRARGLNKGYAFVTMKDDELASVIERTSGADFQGRDLIVNKSLAPGEKAPRRERRPSNMCKLFVGNLSFFTVEETLIQLFEEFGTVVDCYLPKDMDRGGNTSRGFGFVTMAREEAMQAMQELDGCEIDGRSIQINEAQAKRERY